MNMRAVVGILTSVAITLVVIGVANRIGFTRPWVQLALK
jgi:hypothetical protein